MIPLSADGLPLHKPEVLAPAGDWDCARAAIENGADAIYFGLDRFNARMRAGNFTTHNLRELMAELHRRGLKGYLTFNTLVFADELAEAVDFLREAIAAGVDAAIVQDVGVARLIRRLSPDFPIHASTQMTITCDSGVELARELGCSLCVLARECNVSEIAAIQRQQAIGTHPPMPLEVFVHGALCVAYSGQCLTSEALGGRSANRGECAQACRLPYELVSDGKPVPLGDKRYLLSPRDLSGMEVIPELIRTGISSLKIEGRLKTPEYVANVTRVYRDAVDRCFAQAIAQVDAAHEQALVADLLRTHRYPLEMAFSRGLHTGWLRGIDNRNLVHARFGKKRGFAVGEVTAVRPPEVILRITGPLAVGDGVVFDLGRPDTDEAGGRVNHLRIQGGMAVATFHQPNMDWKHIRPGAKVWKTSDPALDKELRATFDSAKPNARRPVRIAVSGRVGEPLVLEVSDESGHRVSVRSQQPLEAAEKHALDAERLRAQLGRLGDRPFELASLANHLEGACMLPVSELNRLRREAFDQLEAERARPPRWTLREDTVANLLRPAVPARAFPQPDKPELVLMVRDPEQLEAALPLAHRFVYGEFEDTRRYKAAATAVRAYRERTGRDIAFFAAPPRIFKMGEEWILRQVRDSGADGYLVRNPEHLRHFEGCRLRGDFPLNVANAIAAGWWLERFPLESLTASYDLNISQLDGLLKSAPPAWFEVTVHQRMPLFHMEHCVFCSFLSTGKDYHDCGRPCEKHRVELRDRVGMSHLLRADAGCRNTVYNGRIQTGAEFAPHLLGLGLRRFRIDFLEDDAAQMARTVAAYEDLLARRITGEQLWRSLKLHNQLGVTRGSLHNA